MNVYASKNYQVTAECEQGRHTDRCRVACSIYRMPALVLFVLAVRCFSVHGEIVNTTMIHDGKERDYILHVPSTYNAEHSMPLVLALHGMGQSGKIQMNASRMNEVSEREGFLVAYPSALQGSWSKDTPDINLGFVDALLDTIQTDYAVDDSRVYATGFSQGAVRSYMLAVERPHVFAAIAPVGGVRPLLQDGSPFPAGLPSLPGRSIPMMHVHGTSDSVVPIEGGSGVSLFPSVRSVVDEWAAHNGCDIEPLVSEFPDERPTDSQSVTLYSYENCSSYLHQNGELVGAGVTHYQVNGGGHEWLVLAHILSGAISFVIA